MSVAASASRLVGVGVPRSLAIADAWAELAGVEPFTGRTGLPLARTMKLVIDPLVLRPALHTHLAPALLSVDAAAELRAAIAAAGDDLAAAASWYLLLKRARRRAGITEGNPQDLYFPRSYELAWVHGRPAADAGAIAARTIAEIHDGTRMTFARLRAHVTDPSVAQDMRRAVERAWRARPRTAARVPQEAIVRFLDACAEDGAEEFALLVSGGAGSAGAAKLERDGAARRLGLTTRDRPGPPEPGASASKSALPPPFDRSILERLFAAAAAIAESALDVADLVAAEILRSAGGWQLAAEPSRVLLLAAAEATVVFDDAAPAPTDAGARMRARWRREPFVHRALRLAEPTAETAQVREAVMRRLWARLHGRELRDEPIGADEPWRLLDGALRSVILDRRGRVKASIARAAVEGIA